MKKISNLLILTLIFVMLFSYTALGVEIKDVPESHWAYDSVKLLVEKGYFSLYEDDTFKGANKVNRYEIAEIIARMLRDTAAGDTEMSDDDVDTLRELSLEFRDELVDIANRQNIFSTNLDKAQKKNVVQDEAIGKINQRMNEVQIEVNEIIDEIIVMKELNTKVDTLTNRVITLEEDLESTNQELAKKDEMITDLKTELQSTDIQKLKDRNSELEYKVSTLESNLQKLENRVNNNNDQLAELTSEEEAEQAAEESGESPIEASNAALYVGAAVLLIFLLGS